MAIKRLPATGDVPRSTGVPDSLVPGGTVDSGGYPWAGRTFDHHVSDYADDDGSTPREWGDAVEAVRKAAAAGDRPALAEAHAEALLVLSRHRLMIPLVTEAGGFGVTPEGRKVEKTQELSMVVVAAPDGRKAMPVFSSVEAMYRWNGDARPIPQPAPQVAVAAAEEGTDLLIVDAATPEREFGVRRTELEAVALGKRVLPSWADPEVIEAFEASVSGNPYVVGIRLAPGDPESRLAAPETDVLLELKPGLELEGLQQILAELQQRWAATPVIADRVDSMRIRLR